MPIDPNSVGQTAGPVRRTWDSKDALLYAVGVGAGTEELAFTTENTHDTPQQVLPTFAVIVGSGAIPFDKLGPFNPAMLVHGEERIELFGPLPVNGEVEITGRIANIWDKGKGAVVEMECESVDKDGNLVMRTMMSAFIRGEGGWGGERGPSPTFELPDRKPDHEVTYKTREDQALTYRLSGDRNPLHSDPWFAKLGGFEKPILHGLCTYGFTGRALLHTLCGGDPAKFKMMYGRFSKPVIPGDELTVSMWVDGNECLYQTKTQSGSVVIDHGRFTFES